MCNKKKVWSRKKNSGWEEEILDSDVQWFLRYEDFWKWSFDSCEISQKGGRVKKVYLRDYNNLNWEI